MGQLCSTEKRRGRKLRGPICLTQSLPCQLSLEKRVLERKEKHLKATMPGSGTLKYCFFWGTPTYTLLAQLKKIDFMRN